MLAYKPFAFLNYSQLHSHYIYSQHGCINLSNNSLHLLPKLKPRNFVCDHHESLTSKRYNFI